MAASLSSYKLHLQNLSDSLRRTEHVLRQIDKDYTLTSADRLVLRGLVAMEVIWFLSCFFYQKIWYVEYIFCHDVFYCTDHFVWKLHWRNLLCFHRSTTSYPSIFLKTETHWSSYARSNFAATWWLHPSSFYIESKAYAKIPTRINMS
jgi:hypothetical protein